MKFNSYEERENLIDQVLEEISQDEINRAEDMLSDDFTNRLMFEINKREKKSKYSKLGLLTCYAACMSLVFAVVLGSEKMSSVSDGGFKNDTRVIYDAEDNKISDFNRKIEESMSKFYNSFEKEVK